MVNPSCWLLVTATVWLWQDSIRSGASDFLQSAPGFTDIQKEAARIAVREVKHFLENDSELETFQFVCFSKTDREIYQEILEQGI